MSSRRFRSLPCGASDHGSWCINVQQPKSLTCRTTRGSFPGVLACASIQACGGVVAACMLLPLAFVLLVVGEDEASIKHATLHAWITRPVIDLGTQVV